MRRGELVIPFYYHAWNKKTLPTMSGGRLIMSMLFG